MKFINKVICFMFGHDYFLIQKLTDWSRRIGCKRCKKSFGMNDNVRVVIDWSEDLEKIYKEFYKVQIIEYRE